MFLSIDMNKAQSERKISERSDTLHFKNTQSFNKGFALINLQMPEN